MENTQKNSSEIRIQGLLDRYLATRESRRRAAIPETGHLDEDSLAAFVEGTLTDRESQPVVSHLVDCSFCLHVTAGLVRLDAAFENEAVTTVPSATQPASVSSVLSGILAKIFGTGEAAVFAHGEEETEEKDEQGEEKEALRRSETKD